MKNGSSDWISEKADALLRITIEVEGRAARVLRAISHLTGPPVEKIVGKELTLATGYLPVNEDGGLGCCAPEGPDPASYEEEALDRHRDTL